MIVCLSTGVVSGDLMLSDQTVLGEWNIEVKAAVSYVLLSMIKVKGKGFPILDTERWAQS